MERVPTVSWHDIAYCKFNTNPSNQMTIEPVSKLTKVKLIGQKKDSGATWCNVLFDRDYVIQFICAKLISCLCPISKESFFELVSEAWDAYMNTPTAKLVYKDTDPKIKLFVVAPNENQQV